MNDSVVAIWVSAMLFALFHSLTATDRCKRFFASIDISSRQYRFAYTLLSTQLTAVWLLFIGALPDGPLYTVDEPFFWICIALQGAGLLIAIASLLPIDGLAFLGIRPFPGNIEPFVEKGIYRYLRHPMYSGAMLLLMASPVQTINSLNLALAVSLYLIAGSRFEEQRLLSANPRYSDYRSRVSAFIPWRTLFRSPESTSLTDE